jgi:uncharacterized Zn finger protein
MEVKIMIVKKIYDRMRRDCSIDIECESCGHKDTYDSAYDDRNFWDNVVPGMKCKNCGKSSKDLNTIIKHTKTKYADNMTV